MFLPATRVNILASLSEIQVIDLVWPNRVKSWLYTQNIHLCMLVSYTMKYSETPLNGHPQYNGHCPDRIFIDFNTLKTPE